MLKWTLHNYFLELRMQCQHYKQRSITHVGEPLTSSSIIKPTGDPVLAIDDGCLSRDSCRQSTSYGDVTSKLYSDIHGIPTATPDGCLMNLRIIGASATLPSRRRYRVRLPLLPYEVLPLFALDLLSHTSLFLSAHLDSSKTPPILIMQENVP